MPYPIAVKTKAISLRKQGYSLQEIADLFNISKSTSSKWLNAVKLDNTAVQRLNSRRVCGQVKANATKRKKRALYLSTYDEHAKSLLDKISMSQEIYKLLAALLFWAEGEKSHNSLVFINSDPNMVQSFLSLLRKAFDINENKFRALLHLHDYHNEGEMKKFWSDLTNIPLEQFYKSYRKPHTGRNIKEGYKGCISVRYHDHKIALELHSIYNMLVPQLTGVG